MTLSDFGSIASIISLFLGIVIGIVGCKFFTIGKNITIIDNSTQRNKK